MTGNASIVAIPAAYKNFIAMFDRLLANSGFHLLTMTDFHQYAITLDSRGKLLPAICADFM